MTGGDGRRKQLLLTALILSVSILPLLLSPWKAQALGASGRGEISFFQSGLTILLTVSAVGARPVYYQVRSGMDTRLRVRFWRSAMFSWLLSGVVLVALIVLGVGSVSGLSFAALALCWFFAPAQLLTQTEIAEAQISGRRRQVFALSSSPALVETVMTLALLVVQKVNVLTSVLVTLLSEAVRAITAGWLYLRGKATAGPRVEARDLSRGSVRLTVVALLPLLIANVDTLVFVLFVSTAQLGQFAVAKIVIGLMLLAATSAEGYVLRSTGTRMRTITYLALGVLAVSLGLAGWVATPTLFGPEFVASQWAFLSCAVAGWMGAIFALTSVSAVASGGRRVATRASSTAALMVVAVSVALGMTLPEIEPWAMALPAIASYLTGYVYLYARRKKLG